MPTGAMDEQHAVVRVQILDERPIVLDALRRALGDAPGVEVTGASAEPAELARPLPDDVVLVYSGRRRWHTHQVSAEDVDLRHARALRHMLAGAVSAALVPTSEQPTLTPLESAALGSAAAGLSATEAARSWGMSVKSVENARGRAKEKLGAVNIAEAVHLAQLANGDHIPPTSAVAGDALGGAVGRAG